MPDLSRDERIRAKAYEIWLSDDMPAGRDFEHWLKAEELVAMEDSITQTYVTDGAPVSRVDQVATFGQHAEAAADLRLGEAPAQEGGMHKQGIGG